MNAGINLYSLRESLKTPEGFDNALMSLKKMGYGYIQVSGVPLAPEQIQEISKKHGLDIYLTHNPLDRIINDTEKLCAEHDLYGCEYIGLGGGDSTQMQDFEKAKAFTAKLEAAALKLEKYGKKFVYHNHNYEFIKMTNGQTFYDYLIENTKSLGFIFDTYWIQMGGVNIEDYIEKMSGRIDCVHLKDFKLEHTTPRFAALGDGNINFKKIIPLLKKAGTKYFFVEQDDADTYENPLSEVEKSIKYLSGL